MYINKYINDFNIKMYNEYLSDVHKLKELADSYINQYSNPTYDCTIAFKESLDHYVSRELENNPSFRNTNLFSNYLKYINYIFSNRVNNNIQLEYNTNILFQNNQTRDIILSYYDDNTKSKLLHIIENNDKIIDNIFNKMLSGNEVSFNELNLVADYLYSRRNLSDDRYSLFVEYLLNMKINFKATPQIVAAYISYLPKYFGEGCEFSRAILSNGIAKSNDIKSVLPSEINKYRGKKKLKFHGLYSSGYKFISMGWSILNGLDLNSDYSLGISRTTKIKDIYWLTMTSFHEMTHQLQNRATKSNEFNSSGLAQLIKGLKRSDTDNSIEHDSIESEIEADENSWKKMHSFLMKFRLGSRFDVNRVDVHEQLNKCLVNKQAVYARRALQSKYDSDDRFFAADMKRINELFNSSDDYKKDFNRMLEDYPMMRMIFDSNCNIRTTIMFDENFTSKNKFGNDENILCCELSNYILNENYGDLKRHVAYDGLSKEQVLNLLMNVYNTYHLEKKFVSSLAKLDLSQLDETNVNIDYKDPKVLRKKNLDKFKNVARLIYKERELIAMINRKYPEYDIESVFPSKYAMWNYDDMFIRLYEISNGVIDEGDVVDIIKMYESTGDEVLVSLANKTRNSIIPSPSFDKKDYNNNKSFN